MTQRNGILHDGVNAAIIDSESKTYYAVAIVSIIVSGIGMGFLFL